MDELRVLLTSHREAAASPVDSIVRVLQQVHLREDVILTQEEFKELNELVVGYCGEALEEVLISFLVFLQNHILESMDVTEQVITIGLESLVQLGEVHPSLVLGKREYFRTVTQYLAKAVEFGAGLNHRVASILLGALINGTCSNGMGLLALAGLSFVCLLEPSRSLGPFLGLLRPNERMAKNPVLLPAGLNALGHILRQRPKCLAKGLPVLLEWYDLSTRFDGFTASQKRNIEVTIKNQLAVILGISEAQPFVPVLTEVLNKRKAQLAQQKASTNAAAKRVQEPVDEPEEKYSKRMRPSAAFAEESSNVKLDILKVPLSSAIEIVLKTCKKIESTLLAARLESWRPSEVAPAPAVKDDPRKRQIKSMSVKDFKKDDCEQFDAEKLLKHLPTSLGRLLDGGLRLGVEMEKFGVKQRKEWAYLIARFSSIQTDPTVEHTLIDYCFGDFIERYGLILLWLRFKWISGSGDEDGHFAYEQVFARILSRVESLVELEPGNSELEVAIGDLLVYAAGSGLEAAICMFFMRGLGMADTDQFEEGEEPEDIPLPTRNLIFKMLQRVLADRPGYRKDVSALVEQLVQSPRKEIREDAFKLCAATRALSPLGELYTKLAVRLIETMAEDCFGLFFELFPLQPDIVLEIAGLYQEKCPAEMKEVFRLKLKLVLQVKQNPELFEQFAPIVESLPSDMAVALIEAIPATVIIPSVVVQAVQERGDTAVLLALSDKLMDKEDYLSVLPELAADTENKEKLMILLSSHAAPAEVFSALHLAENRMGIKRCIEVCNVCFAQGTVWKPDVLLSGLKLILAQCEQGGVEIPATFMRSVIQSHTLYPKALSAGIQTLLSRLISFRVWEAPRLWEGWLRACKALLPASLPLLLQLPIGQITSVLQAVPEAKGPLKEYLWQQPPSLRNRYANVINLVD